MANRIAIYEPGKRAAPGSNVFGKDVANFGLFRALLAHGGFDQVDFLMTDPVGEQDLLAAFGTGGTARMRSASILAQSVAAEAGTLLRGGIKLEGLAWQRRKAVGDSAYSLIGLIHTIAPPSMRQDIAEASIAPVQPWDALICTSPAVHDAMVRMFDEWEDYLGERFGGIRRVRPQLPIIPLGIDQPAFAAIAARPDVRATTRAAMGVEPDDILLIWVGRLSFFEKAFPQPMMRAAEEAARRTGARVHFAMAGWFPTPETQEPMYRAAAAAHAPSVVFHIVDGNDAAKRDAMWPAADIFLSLVDNIQETFGITPLEAMACGLPVVVSDWDGYRSNARDGEDGFLIPTLIGPPDALPDALVGGHALGVRTYQQYVGVIAQHTAVNIGKAADAIAALIGNPDLRRRMGASGARRARETFDWPVIARRYHALVDELAAIRARSPAVPRGPHPVKGDPLRDFAGFASAALVLDARLWLREGDHRATLARAATLQLDSFAANWRGTIEEANSIVSALAAKPGLSVRDLLTRFAAERRRPAQLSLLWMAKIGIIDWLEPHAGPES